MISTDLLKKIRHIEIYTRRMLSGMHVGDYSTAQKGSGFEFDQIREYQEGDDVRFIDWNSSSRMNKLLVRQYLEERNRTIFLIVDCSGSTVFGSRESFKSDIIAQIASVLALVAEYGKDNVGVIICSDTVETYIPAAKGRQHIHKIMETVFKSAHQSKKTSLKMGLEHLINHKIKNALVFIISDFLDDDYQTSLRIAAQRYDCVAIRCLDRLEKSVPISGFLTTHDPETGQLVTLDFRNKKKGVNALLEQRMSEQNTIFKQCAVDLLDVMTDRDVIPDVIRFFRGDVLIYECYGYNNNV